MVRLKAGDKEKVGMRQRTDSCNPPHNNTEVSGHTPGGIRTPNPLIRSQMLYPVELPVHSEEIDTMSLAINQVNAFEGLEPPNAKAWFDCWIQE